MTKVTYIPRDPTDPAVMIWNGVKFPANVPVELDDKLHGYKVPLPITRIDAATGRTLTQHRETWVTMAEQAKGNPSFYVEGEVPVVAPKRHPGRPRIPRTSDDYRSHAQAWIAAADNHEELEERWTEEEALRERCGVGDDDMSYLRPLFEAKHHELKKQAA
jgi:hypothetical protein